MIPTVRLVTLSVLLLKKPAEEYELMRGSVVMYCVSIAILTERYKIF